MQPIYLNDNLIPQTYTKTEKATYKVVHGVYGKSKGGQYMATPNGNAVYLGDYGWEDLWYDVRKTGDVIGQAAKDVAAMASQLADWVLNNPIVVTALNEAGGALVGIPNVGNILAGQANALKRVSADLRNSQGFEGLARAAINLTALTIANAAKGIAGATGKLNKEQTQAAINVLAKDGAFGEVAQKAAIDGLPSFKLPSGESMNLTDLAAKLYKEATSSNPSNPNYAADRDSPTYYDGGDTAYRPDLEETMPYTKTFDLVDRKYYYLTKGGFRENDVAKAEAANKAWLLAHPMIDPSKSKTKTDVEIPTQNLVLGGIGILAAFYLLSKK